MLTALGKMTGMSSQMVFGWIILSIFSGILTAIVMKYWIVRY